MYFAVHPDDRHNSGIVDLDKAPRNANGEVEFSADLFLLRPLNGGNHALLLEIPNRGGSGLMRIVDGGPPVASPTARADFGDAWLLRQGYTVAALGWQWDVPDLPNLLHLYAPAQRTAPSRSPVCCATTSRPSRKAPNGHSATSRRVTSAALNIPSADPADPRNALTVRDTPYGPRQTIPRAAWSFAKTVDGDLVPSDRSILLDPGFEAGRIYELVYVVKIPWSPDLGSPPCAISSPGSNTTRRHSPRRSRLRRRYLAMRTLPARPPLPGLQSGRV